VALLFGGGVLASGFLIVTYFFPLNEIFSRLISVYAFGIGFILLFFSRLAFLKVLATYKKQAKQVYKTLIVGANRVGEKLAQAIEANPYAPYKVIGAIDPYGIGNGFSAVPILGKLDRLESICESEKITAIIQCDGFEQTLNLITFCEEKNIKFQFDPALRGVFEDNLRIREVAGVSLISLVERDFSGAKKWRYRVVDTVLRQVFDVD
jgi:FlaA1/EpsC-like NDP-sugar epimerase